MPRTGKANTGWELRVYTCGKEVNTHTVHEQLLIRYVQILGAGARHFEGGKMEMASEQSGFMRVAVEGTQCVLLTA